MALRIGIGKNLRITPSGTVLIYEPEIVSYIAGLITPLSASHLIRLNQLIIDIKLAVGATTLSDVFDLLYILAGETRESSLRNFINQIFNGVEVGTNTYTQFEGFISDGVTGYIATSFNPTMSGVRFKRDDAGNGLYSRTAKAFDTNQQGGALATINALRTALTARFRLNNATNYEISVTSSIGFTAWYRSNATNAWGVKNKNAYCTNSYAKYGYR